MGIGPMRLAVVGLDRGHAMEAELEAEAVGALLHHHHRDLVLAHRHLAGGPRGLHRLDLLHAALGLDVLGDQLVHRLRRSERYQQGEQGDPGQGLAKHGVCSLSVMR
jgi:hypothetical protein